MDIHPLRNGSLAFYGRDITDRKQAEEHFRQSDEQLAEAQELAHVGSWNWDLATDLLTWSDEHYRICGLERGEGPMTFERGISVVHPDDLTRARRVLDGAVRDGSPYECSLRLLLADGSIRFVHSRGRAAYDAAGSPSRMYGTIQDVTERVRAEEAARVANERLDLAIRGSNIGVWDVDLAPGGDYRRDPVRFINIWEQLGYDQAEFPTNASASRALGHPDDLARVDTAVAACLAGETDEIRVENRIRHKDGSYRWLLTLGNVMRDASGKPVRLIGTVLDITDRKQAEEALRESEAKFREMADTVPGILFTTDLHDSTDYVSQRFYEYTGLPPDTALGDGWQAAIHPEDLQANLERWQALLAQGAPYDFQFRLRSADGGYRWFLSRSRPMHDDQGNIIRWIGSVHDVDDLVQLNGALRASEERFRGTFENAAVGITHRHAQGQFLLVNKRFCHIVGYSHEELLGKTFDEITFAEDLSKERELVEALVQGKLPSYSIEKRYVRKDGSLVWTEVTASMQRDAAGNPSYVIALVQDISKRKLLEHELSVAKEFAESANRAKDEFLANVSHEIRTPFGAILGMTELVLDTALTDEQRQDLEIVRSESERLLGLVTDLLDFSKIESRKVELNLADFSLRAVVSDVSRIVLPQAQLKGLALTSHVDPIVPDMVVGDADKLRMVLLNLMNNAVKFTKVGDVSLKVGVVETTDDMNTVKLRFAVSDTGIGVPDEKQSRIFRPFEQADNSTTRRYGGTGLGLTIANDLVALMGGTIGVESEPGSGSTFAFEILLGFPSGRSATHEPATAIPTLAAPLRVLVAEDNEANAQYVEHLLTRRGHIVRVAANGREALAELELPPIGENETQLAAAGPKPHRFNLLLLDLHMPDVDGFEVVRTVRHWEQHQGGHLPIIALTARSRVEDREQCLEAGIDVFLSKPVRMRELVTAIQTVLAGHA
jgi:PAS domain S-box-containing protein